MVRIMNQNYSINELWKLKGSIIKPLLSFTKIRNFYLIKLSELFKKIEVIGYPYSMLIEPTAFCNLNCPMCLKTQKKLKRREGNMNLERFEFLMKELGKRMITLRFWNYGEPLMNKDLFKMIKLAKKYRIFTVVSTNALLFNKENINEMLDSGLDYLIISFDGSTKKSYEKYRKNGDFNRLIKNIIMLMKIKEERKKKLPFISLQFIVMKGNEEEIDDIKDFSKKFKVDKVSLRRLNVVSENGKKLLPEKELFRDQPIQGKENWCSLLWEESVINYDGTVTPCCMDAGMQHIFGNVFEEGAFKKIWNNEKYKTFRKAILTNIDTINICDKDCYKRSNKLNFIDL